MMIRKGLCPTLQTRPKDQERIILHLDLDAFFAQVEEVADPLLRGKPILIVGHSMTSGVVLTASYEARKYGVKTGMALREARRLCPFAVLVPADCAKYADTSEQIFAHFTAYTPLVEIFSIDEAFLDVTDTYFYWETPEGVAQTIKQWVQENFALTLSIGIAPNKLLAKLASGLKKPNGLFHIRPAEVQGVLKDLPIEELCGIGSRLKVHLNGMGIFTAAELGAFSEPCLVERFGILGSVLKRMGQGIDHSPVLPSDHPDHVKSIGHSYTLTHPTRDRNLLFCYLLWLSEKVARRLRRRGLEGQVVHTVIRFSDFETLGKQRRLGFFLNEGVAIFRYAKQILLEIDRRGGAVRLLGVSVSGLRPANQEGWLFEDFKRRDRLMQALDNINDKYGELTLRPAFLTFPDDRKIASRALQLFGSGRY